MRALPVWDLRPFPAAPLWATLIRMKDTRRNRIWTLTGVVALALTGGVMSNRMLARRSARVSADEDLRDAVASPPATAGLAGRPVPTTWFKTPAERKSEMDSALLSSRRRRALAQRVSVQ
jgi:hypothetical protein